MEEDEDEDNHVNLKRHLFKVFVIGFTITLAIQLIILILFLPLGQYINVPQKFGIGYGSFQIMRLSKTGHYPSSGLLIIALAGGIFNTLLHYLRKHTLRENT